jgi:predicted acetyltransferase
MNDINQRTFLTGFNSKNPMSNNLKLVKPALEFLPGYVAALESGWSPDTARPATALEEMEAIRKDAALFVARLDDPEAKGGPITLPDGSQIPRLPGFIRWIWDGTFCGSIGFRWQPGTSELPPHSLGHIGYGVVPWKRGLGYAKGALGLLLEEVRGKGLTYVELTSDPANAASQAVILANGGQLVERFKKTAAHGGKDALRFRIFL